MRHIVVCLFAAAVAAIGAACQPASPVPSHEHETHAGPVSDPAPQRFTSRGLVKSITPSRTFIVIAHEEIPDFMDAMTMSMRLQDTSLVAGVAAGDSVAFVLAVNGPDVSVVELESLSGRQATSVPHP